MADQLYRGRTTEEVLADIVRLAAELLPHADHVTISSVNEDRSLTTRAATDELAWQIDRLETEAREGPCVDTVEKDAVQRDPDIAADTPWPRLRDLVLERTPVRGMLGFRLLTGSGRQAALNVFSDTPGVLTEEVADLGAVLAGFASVALTAVEHREGAEELRQRLAEDREIGKAVGLLMAAHGMPEEKATALLEEVARSTGSLLDAARNLNEWHRHDDG
jgi:hypothetical protein